MQTLSLKPCAEFYHNIFHPYVLAKVVLQTVAGSYLLTFVKNRYQIEFDVLQFHRFFSPSILQNFSQLFWQNAKL